MWIDLISLSVFALFVLVGVITGGISQLLRLIAAAVAFYFAPAVADFYRPYVGGLFVDLNEFVLQGASLILAVTSVYLLLVVISWLTFERLLEESTFLGAMDRVFGGILGGVKAALLILVVGHALYMMSATLPADQVHQSLLLQAVDMMRMDRFLDLSHLGGELLEWFELDHSA
jgi:uncharacterized membrane protein required for colicin V production